jgi:hypothetical protein
MPRFKIIPKNQPLASAEIIAPDAKTALDVVASFASQEADVEQDDGSRFSIRQDGNGVWTISARLRKVRKTLHLVQ